ncbi:MAG: heat-inducible transcription repressor HrcA [Clostridia bacterium]|nr:heat-inducible transcription repressor HrcA [Clostridia bacterium]
MPMDERKKKVLLAIVKDFISTAEPVGSRTIARKYQLGVSPATIRNEMADLEEMGYIEQPHTSAGRVPSDSGYRYYVDCLMEKQTLGEAEKEYIRQRFSKRIREIQDVINVSAELLSEMSNYTSLIMGPYQKSERIKQVALLPLATDKALLVAVSQSNAVSNYLLDIPPSLTEADLERITRVWNSRLKGVAMAEIGKEVLDDIYQELYAYRKVIQAIVDVLLGDGDQSAGGHISLSGALNIFNQPEFKDLDKVRGILELLESPDVIREILANSPETGLSIKIGGENQVEGINECSVVTATYVVDGELMGHIGILGPTRMDYAKTVTLVETMAQQLREVLSKLYE